MTNEETDSLTWKDILAYIVALLTTQLLPIILILVIVLALTIIALQMI